jgi:hypothetical protein
MPILDVAIWLIIVSLLAKDLGDIGSAFILKIIDSGLYKFWFVLINGFCFDIFWQIVYHKKFWDVCQEIK